jgi:hypothetical protein
LAHAVFEALPEEHKFMFNSFVKEQWKIGLEQPLRLEI